MSNHHFWGVIWNFGGVYVERILMEESKKSMTHPRCHRICFMQTSLTGPQDQPLPTCSKNSMPKEINQNYPDFESCCGISSKKYRDARRGSQSSSRILQISKPNLLPRKNWHGTRKAAFWKGKSSSKPSCWGSMLIFRGARRRLNYQESSNGRSRSCRCTWKTIPWRA